MYINISFACSPFFICANHGRSRNGGLDPILYVWVCKRQAYVIRFLDLQGVFLFQLFPASATMMLFLNKLQAQESAK